MLVLLRSLRILEPRCTAVLTSEGVPISVTGTAQVRVFQGTKEVIQGGDPGGDLAGEGDEGAEVPQGGGGAAPGQDRESAAAHAARHSRGPFKVSLYAELLHKIKIN